MNVCPIIVSGTLQKRVCLVDLFALNLGPANDSLTWKTWQKLDTVVGVVVLIWSRMDLPG